MSESPNPPDTTLKHFQRRLANISGRSKALFMLRQRAEQDIDVDLFNKAVAGSGWAIIEQLLGAKSTITLLKSAQMGSAEEQIRAKLKAISRKEKSIFEESGAADLFLAWPFVQGQLPGGAAVRAPLLLFPVGLKQSNGDWLLTRREDDPVTINRTFLLAFSHHSGIALSDDLLEQTFDFDWDDSLSFRNKLYELLKTTPLNIHFNQDLYRNPLQPFLNFTRKDFDHAHQQPGLKLAPEAVIGLFPQADGYLGADYDLLMEVQTTVEQILDKPLAEPLPSQPLWPIATDGSQQAILGSHRQGASILVQGPPGTGKSQLIVNLIADHLAAGKSVLMVSQKRAALDVVHRRLQEIGIGQHVALVHDFKDDRAAIFAQIAALLAQRQELPQAETSLSYASLTEKYNAASEALSKIETDLELFRKALYARQSAGISPKEMYMQAQPVPATIQMADLLPAFKHADLLKTSASFLQIISLSGHIGPLSAFWHQRKSLHLPAAPSLAKLKTLLGPDSDAIVKLWLSHFGTVPTHKSVQSWFQKLSSPKFLIALQTLSTFTADLDVRYLVRQMGKKQNGKFLPAIKKRVLKFKKRAPFVISFEDALVQQALATMPTPDAGLLANYISEAKQAIDAGFFAKHWFLLTHPGRKALRVLAEGAEINGSSMAQIKTKYAAFADILAFRNFLKARFSKLHVPAYAIDSAGWQRTISALQKSLWSVSTLKKLNLKRRIVRRQILKQDNTSAWFTQILQHKAAILAYYTHTKAAFNAAQMGILLSASPDMRGNLLAEIDRVYEYLTDLDTLVKGLSTPQRKVLVRVQKHPQPAWEGILSQSWASAWLERLEGKDPSLRLGNAERLDFWAQEGQKAQAQLSALGPALLQAQLQAAASYSPMVGKEPKAYKDLAQQVSKKRMLWPLRKLITGFLPQLQEQMPCWLASPETVSAIFPLVEGLFDVVVFDEASQCFAERALPAAYRGKKILVTGDSQQLQPNNLYLVRIEGSEADLDDNPDLETTSLLDLAARYLPQQMLMGHYRSHHPDLIAFSNRHFYADKLQALPTAATVMAAATCFGYTDSQGTWQSNTNPEEATLVVLHVLQLLQQVPNQSIGVVTFNAPQQTLILDLLEDAAQANNIVLPSTLFVKNIENVQGDERDIIIFSIGYAPDSDGKLRMQFGSLSTSGGENRLNVAVSRARQAIHVFSSIRQEHFRLSDSSPRGVQLLAAFLAFAQQASQGAPTSSSLASIPMRSGIAALHDYPADSQIQIPFADLAYTSPAPTLLFTDDAKLEASPSAYDYLIAKPAFAKALGWQTEVLFSRDWFHKSLKS